LRSSPGNTKPEVEKGARGCEGGIFDRGIGISGEDQLKWLYYLARFGLTNSPERNENLIISSDGMKNNLVPPEI
jgi:hypothetical protein